MGVVPKHPGGKKGGGGKVENESNCSVLPGGGKKDGRCRPSSPSGGGATEESKRFLQDNKEKKGNDPHLLPHQDARENHKPPHHKIGTHL